MRQSRTPLLIRLAELFFLDGLNSVTDEKPESKRSLVLRTRDSIHVEKPPGLGARRLGGTSGFKIFREQDILNLFGTNRFSGV